MFYFTEILIEASVGIDQKGKWKIQRHESGVTKFKRNKISIQYEGVYIFTYNLLAQLLITLMSFLCGHNWRN